MSAAPRLDRNSEMHLLTAFEGGQSLTQALTSLGVPASFFEARPPQRSHRARQIKLTFGADTAGAALRHQGRVALAERRGYHQGLDNVHYGPPIGDTASSDEWLAWLRGWRRGQSDRTGHV